MSRFGSDPQAFFNAIYQDAAPWDIGGPQPSLSALFAEIPPADPVLDVGCGSGDLALYLAQLGNTVTGIDFVEAAIAQAQQKKAALPSPVAARLDFQVGDALEPSRLGRPFGAIVDSGFLHLLDFEQSERFVDELAASLRPGGRYYLLAFAIDFGIPNVPRGVSADEVRARFTEEKGWHIQVLRTAEFLSRVAPPVAATCACVERLDAGPR